MEESKGTYKVESLSNFPSAGGMYPLRELLEISLSDKEELKCISVTLNTKSEIFLPESTELNNLT